MTILQPQTLETKMLTVQAFSLALDNANVAVAARGIWRTDEVGNRSKIKERMQEDSPEIETLHGLQELS